MAPTYKAGLSFLHSKQQPDGGFLTQTSPEPTLQIEIQSQQIVFSAALILDCVSHLPSEPLALLIREKLVNFLLDQKSKRWSWNYWHKNSNGRKVTPYPDDLDDTFGAAAALYHHDPALVDGSALAHLVALLTSTETQVGGPYRTWLAPTNVSSAWQDVDLAVNSNIAYFLSLLNIQLPNLVLFTENAIQQNYLSSPYYPSLYPIIYFISRWYRGDYKNALQTHLLIKRDSHGSWGNPLHTALAISALIRWDTPLTEIEKGITYLKETEKRGVWPAYGLWLDHITRGTSYWTGSAVLTTAFCLEAYSLYEKRIIQKPATPALHNKARTIEAEVLNQVQHRFDTAGKSIATSSHSLIKHLVSKDTSKQITLLPYYFREALGKNGELVTDEMVTSLGAATLYGWSAYTIYDDFFDEEGRSCLLPLANTALRELTHLAHTLLPQHQSFLNWFNQTMDTMEAANMWEVEHCRNLHASQPPRFAANLHLAHRSLGHAIGPIGILCTLGYELDSPEIQHTTNFFQQYLIARQLNDDAHDWEQDFEAQRITPVIALLWTSYDQQQKEPFHTASLGTLRSFFWHEVIPNVCSMIELHLTQAKDHIARLSIIQHPSYLEEILSPIERSIQKAQEERKNTLQFLAEYKSS